MKLIASAEHSDCFSVDLEAENLADATLLGRLLIKASKRVECMVVYPINNGAPQFQIRLEKNKNKQYSNAQIVGSGKPI